MRPAIRLVLLLLLVAAGTARAVTIEETVDIRRRFGEQTCPTCIGQTWTYVFPGERFMYNVQSKYECFSCDGYATTLEVEFPDSVVPRLEVYPAEIVTVAGNLISIHLTRKAGFGLNLPFDVKAEGDLAPDATSIRLDTTITVVPPSGLPLVNHVQDSLPLRRRAAFTATAAAAPSEVRVSDPNAVITVTATFQNVGENGLMHVAPSGDPTPSAAGVVEKIAGPTPASVDLAPGATGSVAYTYRPKKAGKVTFGFEGFLAQGVSGVVGAPAATTGEVTVKEDVEVDVTASPSSLTTDSSPTSTGTVTVKVTDKNGEPVSGQSVALGFPQYFGIVDLNPRLLVCDAEGALVFPPGADPTLNDAAYATTSDSGEASFRLVLGTQRRTAQLFVLGAALDAEKLKLGDDGLLVDLAPNGTTANPVLHVDLDQLQRADLPAAERAANDASIVPRGAPREVLGALVRWLETKREAGGTMVSRFDWVPIASGDDRHVGVLLYPQADLAAVLAHFDGGPVVPSAYVLQIEQAGLGFFGHEVKWERPWMSLDTWENVPLDSNGLVIPGSTDIPRLRAKPAGDLVTTSPYAFLGYPYPAAGSAADGGYGDAACVPKLDGVSVSVHSPVTLLVKDVQGRAVGLGGDGAWTNALPGAVYTGGEPTRILLPPGSYTADIVGTGKGPATIVLAAPGVTPRSMTFQAKPGKTGTLAFDAALGSAAGRFGKKKLRVTDGIPITVTGVKKRLAVRAGDPLTLTVTNLFGRAVAGARVHAAGKEFAAEARTGADGTATIVLAVTKKTKKLVLTIDGADVEATTLKVRVKLRKR
ncbi:MAG: hypothetical protein KIT14_17190 [bacterium]|nr:hypothetical protein [bacterium]